MNRRLGAKAREARRLGRECALKGVGRNPYRCRPLHSEEFVLWSRFVLGYLSVWQSKHVTVTEANNV